MRLPAIALRPLIGSVLTLVCVACICACLLLTGWLAVRHETAQIGNNLGISANSLRDRLQPRLESRLRDIELLALPLGLAPGPEGLKASRSVLEALAERLPAYAWIGAVATDGTVLAATRGVHEGENVARQPWFRAGLEGPTLSLPSPDMPAGQGGLVDVSAPVRDKEGKVIGVVGAQVSRRWINTITSLLSDVATDGNGAASALLLDAGGHVLAGGESGSDLSALASVRQARSGEGGYLRERWLDGKDHLVGYALWRPSRRVADLGWVVLVSEPVSSALTPVKQLLYSIMAAGALLLVLALMLAWLLARAISAPLSGLAAAARALQIGVDGDGILPRAYGLREVGDLSLALRSMLMRLSVAERQREKLQSEGEQTARRLEDDLSHARHMADTDPLTGLFNRRALMRDGLDLLARLCQQGRCLSAIMLDIDHFKLVNDRFGHMVGDAALLFVAECARQSYRESDLIARIGGEEFTILLPGADLRTARELAERLRTRIGQGFQTAEGIKVSLTVSLGCAEVKPGEGLEAMLDRADRALYAAKTDGRNRVCIAAMSG
ncbi:diguanylate cyclase [Radicibacter daui]|uniref:diguanylate cyclase n=1 Tax=Radicibacter daui TaxID=3064829 RepID=UPI004046DCDF